MSSKFSIKLVNGSDDIPVEMVFVPTNASTQKGQVLEVKNPSMAESAVNAAVDYFHFGGEFVTMAQHMDVGFHAQKDWSNLPYGERVALVGPNYTGIAVDRPTDYWKVVNINNGRTVLTRTHPKEGRKHDFVDLLLKGYTLRVSTAARPEWATKVAETISNPDKAAAWEAYQERKSLAARKERTFQKGRKIVRRGQVDESSLVLVNGKATPLSEVPSGLYEVLAGGRYRQDIYVNGNSAGQLQAISNSGWELKAKA